MDPLTEVVALLQPSASFSKTVSCAGGWRVRRAEAGRPFYCVVLGGSACLTIPGREPTPLQDGDFVLVPSAYDFAMSSLEPPPDDIVTVPVEAGRGEFRLGPADVAPDVRLLVGYCEFGSPDAAMLVSLLPQLVHVRGESRLATLVRLVADEARDERPGREAILARLLEVLLIEAFRSSETAAVSRGLVRGLADRHIAVAIRRLHETPTRPWTVAQLAKEAALSRSAFFDRFNRTVGLAPMEYLLAWRMALAKGRLRRNEGSITEVAEYVGYSSASAFSVAFARHVGMPPARYGRQQASI